jgi:ABC-type uncharacterized transport system ATPase subunit
MTSAYKDVVMIGGPNGAGKTTAATTLLPKVLPMREFAMPMKLRGLSPLLWSATIDDGDEF